MVQKGTKSISNPPFMMTYQLSDNDKNRSPFHRGLRLQDKAEQICNAMSRDIIVLLKKPHLADCADYHIIYDIIRM